MIPEVVRKWQEYEKVYSTKTGPVMDTSLEYMIYDAMHEWGMSPETFEKLHPSHQALMMAFVASMRLREAYTTDFYDKQAKDKN